MNLSRLISATFTLVAFSFMILSCTKDVGMKPPKPAFDCDTVTYNRTVKPLIELNCVKSGCHNDASKAGNVAYTSYQSVKLKVDEGKIMKRAVEDNAVAPMPPTGQLPKAQRDLIRCWIEKGAINN